MTPTPEALPVAWRISSYSSGASGNCVEAGPVVGGSGHVAVRDSTRRADGMFMAERRAWSEFTAWVSTLG